MTRTMQHLGSLVMLAALLAPVSAFAWNPTGHRVIVSIAYRQLDESTWQKLGALLRNHPAAAQLWTNRASNGPDEVLNLLWNASVFPDEARRPPWDRYNHPKAHYVNYRILSDQGNTVAPPLPDENVLDSYVDHCKAMGGTQTPAAEQALHLSWILHQASDIHQPLHAVARFSKALPHGDRGGNEVHLPNPRGLTERSNNLHAYWDDLLGNHEDPAATAKLADQIMAENPRTEFSDDLKKKGIRDWAEESVQTCLATVYQGLDPETPHLPAAPAGYDDEAVKVGRKRIALAGYRLAEELKRLLADR